MPTKWLNETPPNRPLPNPVVRQLRTPALGVRLMLASRGTCNTVTAVDQLWPRFQPDERVAVAGILVDHLHAELHANLRAEVERREGAAPDAAGSLRPLLAGRPWLTGGGAYHTDVSHLQAVVRCGRSLRGTGVMGGAPVC